jgi:hypothetical protein
VRQFLTLTKKTRGEAPVVPEPIKPDGFVQGVKRIRDHRLQMAEAELLRARKACEASRAIMTQCRGRVAQAQADADHYWQRAMTDFREMQINAREFVARKSQHQKLKLRVAVVRNEVRETVRQARVDREQLRLAQRCLKSQQLQVEKLRLLKDLQLAELVRMAA